MANKKHLAKLKEGVTVWNAWRAENEEIWPDLSEANLTGADLRGADLARANLDGADLRGANLTGPHHVLIGLVMKGWINAFDRDGEPEFIPQPAMALRF